MRTKKIAILAMIIAMASVMHWLESLLPPLLPTVPGVRLGLANIFTLVTLAAFGVPDAFAVAGLRCLLGAALGGSLSSFLYAFAGAMLSCAVMSLIHTVSRGKVSLYGVSVAGAVFHNVGQLAVAALILETGYLFSYLPVMSAVAVPTGMFVGLCAYFIMKTAGKAGFLKKE
ncbi:MAG: Gx transporter family protein [Christensenellales bacterium]|jgi:heptaprenyl diphosphate synthase